MTMFDEYIFFSDCGIQHYLVSRKREKPILANEIANSPNGQIVNISFGVC